MSHKAVYTATWMPSMTKYALFLTCVIFAASGDKRVVFPASAKPVGPYSPGIFAGEFLYVSGQGARAPNGQIPATFDEQARQSFEDFFGDAGHIWIIESRPLFMLTPCPCFFASLALS